MEQLILLGQIPGTSLHITFGVWLVIALAACVTFGVTYDRHHNHRLFISLVYVTLRLQKHRMLKHFDQIAL